MTSSLPPPGDLKPGNVLLASAPGSPLGYECKVSDFGLATALESTEQTITHENWGTVVYMAPESCAGRCRKASVSGAGCSRARGRVDTFGPSGSQGQQAAGYLSARGSGR